MEKWVVMGKRKNYREDYRDTHWYITEFYLVNVRTGFHGWVSEDWIKEFNGVNKVINIVKGKDPMIQGYSENKPCKNDTYSLPSSTARIEKLDIEDLTGIENGEPAYVIGEVRGFGYKIIRMTEMEDRIPYGEMERYMEKFNVMNVEVVRGELRAKKRYTHIVVIDFSIDDLIYNYQLKNLVMGRRILNLGIKDGRVEILWGNWGLKLDEVPEFVSGIGEGAFQNGIISNNKVNELLRRVKVVGDRAFMCAKVVDRDIRKAVIIIPSNVESIGDGAFYGAAGYDKEKVTVELQGLVRHIGSKAFHRCICKGDGFDQYAIRCLKI